MRSPGCGPEDGEYDVDGWHMRSRADIAEMVRSPAHQGLIGGGSAHFLGPVHIDVAGDEAVAVCESSLVRHNEDGSGYDVAAFADAMNPMGRIGDPYLDIAPVALFLAGEGCRYLTGNTLFVDGGSHINGVAWTPDLDAAPQAALASRGGEVVAGQAKCSGQPLRARRERHLHRSRGRDDVAFLDVRAAVAASHRLALQVPVVEIRIGREEDGIIRRHVAIGAAVAQPTALHEAEVSDVVRRAVSPGDDERRLARGGQLGAFGHDRIEADILAGERFAKYPEVS